MMASATTAVTVALADSAVFGIDDDMTIYRAAELRSGLQAAVAALPSGAELVLDLGGVTDMDSAGVQLLLAARKAAVARGCRLRVAHSSPAVRDVLSAMDLGGLLETA